VRFLETFNYPKMDTTSITHSSALAQQLENERHRYVQAFEQDKPFAFIKTIQIRIRHLEKKINPLFKIK